MTRKKPSPPTPSAGYSETAKVALRATTARVREMHEAISKTSFEVLTRIPGISGPAKAIQGAHDAIAGGVYSAIHLAGGSLLDFAGAIEKRQPASTPSASPPGRLASNLRSAINGAFGDHLAGMGSVLAIDMGIYRQGIAIPLNRDALARIWPDSSRQRVCLFIHGLVCNENCWSADDKGVDMPRQIEQDTEYTALTLRYNTGRPIAENGLQLALLLDELLAAWPHPLKELLLIGHSMGGLLARSATEQSRDSAMAWPARTRMIICLGSPQLGSPVERLGHLTTTALAVSRITRPLAKLAANRSQGIQDLRHGPGRHDADTSEIAWRFIGGSLSEDPDNPLGTILGDGLVTPDSATAHALQGDVASVRLGGIGHMQLLTAPRVYAQILSWLPV